ncbi:hypothetical protein FRC07_007125, partial [Ceratobasidium sp. 392]
VELHFDPSQDRKLVDGNGNRLLNADILRYFFALVRRREQVLCTVEPGNMVDQLVQKLKLAAQSKETNHSLAYERPWDALWASLRNPTVKHFTSPQQALSQHPL